MLKRLIPVAAVAALVGVAACEREQEVQMDAPPPVVEPAPPAQPADPAFDDPAMPADTPMVQDPALETQDPAVEGQEPAATGTY